MPAAPRAKTKDSGGAKASPKIEVKLEVMSPKKHSVRYETEARPVAITNVYLSAAAYTDLGSPNGLKITIEPLTP